MAISRSIHEIRPTLVIVGAAEGCDLLTLIFQDQKIAAFGSSYRGSFSFLFHQEFL
jgi:hypothetical protein